MKSKFTIGDIVEEKCEKDRSKQRVGVVIVDPFIGMNFDAGHLIGVCDLNGKFWNVKVSEEENLKKIGELNLIELRQLQGDKKCQ